MPIPKEIITSFVSRKKIKDEVFRLLDEKGLSQDDLIDHLIENYGAPATFYRRYIHRISETLKGSNLTYFIKWIDDQNPFFSISLNDPIHFFRERTAVNAWIKIIPCELNGFGEAINDAPTVFLRNRYRFLVKFPFQGYFELFSFSPHSGEPAGLKCFRLTEELDTRKRALTGTHVLPAKTSSGLMVGGKADDAVLVGVCTKDPLSTVDAFNVTAETQLSVPNVQALIAEVAELTDDAFSVSVVDYEVRNR